MERWKDIEGYKNYEVSDKGRIRNKKSGRIIKQSKLNSGHCKVELFKDGIKKSFLVNRLVLENFMGLKDRKIIVKHKDGNKENNSLNNFELIDFKEHSKRNFPKDSEATKRRNEKISKNKSKKVICKNNLKVFDSIKQAAQSLGGHRENLTKHLTGKAKSFGKDQDGNKLYWEYYLD